ncbi:MAG: TIR domain-containing protein [Anaerolineaceae bacterium]|nr:TIR domain-containing protein [Anaerolineaceae bacterium]
MDGTKILIVIILAAIMVVLAWAFLRRRNETTSPSRQVTSRPATFQPPLQQGGKPEKKAAPPPPRAAMPAAPPQPAPSREVEQARKGEKEESPTPEPQPVDTFGSILPEEPEESGAAPAANEAADQPDADAPEVEEAPVPSRDDLLKDFDLSYPPRTPEAKPVETSVPATRSNTAALDDDSADESDLLDDVIRYQSPVPEPKPQKPPLPATEMPTPGVSRRDESAMQNLNAVHFSAYYPREVKPKDWQPLKAYLFRQFMAAKVAEDAQAQLGERLVGFRKVQAAATTQMAEGAMVTATPQIPGFQFNPPSMTVGFYKDMHRFDFELRATDDAPLDQATNGTITFTVEGIVVGDVPISIFVGETADSPAMTSAETKIYEAVFCSYSHDDTTIVERVERAYKALGLDYLRDVMTLKAGQDWSDELLNLIDQADIFQLFWSHTAAASQHVRYEWEHALKIAPGREKFIRPVYWEQPMPPTPPELGHIHFTYQPDLGK